IQKQLAVIISTMYEKVDAINDRDDKPEHLDEVLDELFKEVNKQEPQHIMIQGLLAHLTSIPVLYEDCTEIAKLLNLKLLDQERSTTMRKLFLGVIAILLIGMMTACSEEEEDQSEETEKVTPVETVEAEEGDLTIDKTMNGRTKPGSSKPIMLESPGELETLEVANGDEVDKDDTIATIKTPAGNQTLYAPQS